MLEHAIDGVQELAYDCDQGNHLELATLAQVLVEGAQVGLVSDGDQGGHVKGAAQVNVTVLADTNFFMHGSG